MSERNDAPANEAPHPGYDKSVRSTGAGVLAMVDAALLLPVWALLRSGYKLEP
ncbi:MAG: hypothetical protein HY521_11735 [Proteobacteria bacterium]|nr:hypothetical protein [Pseudomonadota bacterium]